MNKQKPLKNSYQVALAGNPNVGKSTIFNALTGSDQHTGNWCGKTVVTASGKYHYKSREYVLTDLPGTYSLDPDSPDEEAAEKFLLRDDVDCVVIVTDAINMERNLNLVLEILSLTTKAVLCINMIDEAHKHGVDIDTEQLSSMLRIPVVISAARSGKGIDDIKQAVMTVIGSDDPVQTPQIRFDRELESAIDEISRYISGDELHKRYISMHLADKSSKLRKKYISEKLSLRTVLEKTDKQLSDRYSVGDIIKTAISERSSEIYRSCIVSCYDNSRQLKADRILTSRLIGIPVIILLLTVIFFITIIGANYPSELLNSVFSFSGEKLTIFLSHIGIPEFLKGLLIDGIFKTTTNVISVMLPPMAIFFPLFTLLEDSGFLPRLAFNLDPLFKSAGTNGKQALTTMMGFGCNACGVTGCRIFSNNKERRIAASVNAFTPCNGRFPTLIALISMFMISNASGPIQTLECSAILVIVILFSFMMTLAASRLLSCITGSKKYSPFILELPPYRKPQVLKTIYRSFIDKTISVSARAVTVAAPAGAVIWLLANVNVGDQSILSALAQQIDPLAKIMGLDGVILLAFVLGFPANEIVLPIMLMIYLSESTIAEYGTLDQLHHILLNNGWSITTAVCTIIFILMHFPCSTTCITIYKETKSLKWTIISAVLPTVFGVVCCIIANGLCSVI